MTKGLILTLVALAVGFAIGAPIAARVVGYLPSIPGVSK